MDRSMSVGEGCWVEGEVDRRSDSPARRSIPSPTRSWPGHQEAVPAQLGAATGARAACITRLWPGIHTMIQRALGTSVRAALLGISVVEMVEGGSGSTRVP